jgi:hypothetical protein
VGTLADSNDVTIYRGSLGIAIFEADSADFATLKIGYTDSRDSDAVVWLGKGCVSRTITKTGGELYMAGRSGTAITSLTQSGGVTTIDGTDGVTALVVSGGTVYYNTSGTLAGNPRVSGTGVLDFSRDLRAKTVTNPIEVYGDAAQVLDPEKVVSSLVVDYNFTTRLSALGDNIRVTRGATA